MLECKHGMFGTHFYKKWAKAKERCTNKNNAKYAQYGGRGIIFSERWNDFINFKEDMYESYLEHLKKYGKENTTLDRIDVNKGYCKENCKWATWREQNGNKQDTIYYKGQCLRQYCVDNDLNYKIIWQRIKRDGMSIEMAINTPIISDRLDNLENKKFGDFVVVERDKTRIKTTHTYWICRCDNCGRIVSKYAGNLKRGKAINCNCKKR